MAHYVICDNKCLEEAYTKTEINTNLATKANKDDFVLLEFDGSTTSSANYPTGFSMDNTMVVGKSSYSPTTQTSEYWKDLPDDYNNNIIVTLESDKIYFSGFATSCLYRILIQKVSRG